MRKMHAALALYNFRWSYRTGNDRAGAVSLPAKVVVWLWGLPSPIIQPPPAIIISRLRLIAQCRDRVPAFVSPWFSCSNVVT